MNLGHKCEVCGQAIHDSNYIGTGPALGAVRFYHHGCAPPLVPIEVSRLEPERKDIDNDA